MAFDPEPGRIDFHRPFASGTRFACPHCGAKHQPVHDTLERDWRHLNFFQFQAYIHAKVPRVRCHTCQDYPQVGVPWARPNSGFTRRMEALRVHPIQGDDGLSGRSIAWHQRRARLAYPRPLR